MTNSFDLAAKRGIPEYAVGYERQGSGTACGKYIERIAELEAALKQALPYLDENFRWHRDMQSSPSRVDAAHKAMEVVRAALGKETR